MSGRNKAILIVVTIILISPCFVGVKASTTKIKESQDHNPILFLHGWTKSMMDWVTMKEWFKADGWLETALYAYNFDDRSNCDVQANINNANRIKQWVDTILNDTGAEKIDLVGHSMGGLSSRYYIKYLGGIDKVDDYASLGADHHGDIPSRYTSCPDYLPWASSMNEGDETPGGILNDTLGNRTDPISGIIYNSTHIPGTINYTSIYSRDDEWVSYISSPLDGAHNIEVENLFHSDLYQDEAVYGLVKTAVDDPHPPTTTTTQPTTTTTTTTTTITTTMTTTEETPLMLLPVVVAMSVVALIMIPQRRQNKRIRI